MRYVPQTPAELGAYATGYYHGEGGFVYDPPRQKELRAAYLEGFDQAREDRGIPR